MILFIGQVARGMREREAFQEVDYRRFFGDIAKWVVEIDDAGAHSRDSSPAPLQSRPPAGRARSSSRCRKTC